MRRYIYGVLFSASFLNYTISHAQFVSQLTGTSASCNVNVNAWQETGERYDIRRSVVNLIFNNGSACTGTLLNRFGVGDQQVGNYILTARHCVWYPDGPSFNNTTLHDVVFNFQTDDYTATLAPTNHDLFTGQNIQSTDNLIGVEYLHRTPLRVVAKYFWGDFALLEVVDPPPPYFNMYYAGWTPRPVPVYPIGTLSGQQWPYVVIEHPSGDMKKITGTDRIIPSTEGISIGCITITTVIDVLFGWIWGQQVSTQVICNYIDNPWMLFRMNPGFGGDKGSSGSSIFTVENKTVGILSGWGNDCDIHHPNTFGKFRNNYFEGTVYNVLNPNHSIFPNLDGTGGRQVSCYTNIELNERPNLTFNLGQRGHYLFPANHYMNQNKIYVKAENNFTTNTEVIVMDGADYEFHAGDNVTLNPGFDTQLGANFLAKIEACTAYRAEDTTKRYLANKLHSKPLPDKLEFNINDHLTPKQLEERPGDIIIEVYPNPTTLETNLSLKFYEEVMSLDVIVTNMYGQEVFKDHKSGVRRDNLKIDLSGVAPGSYNIQIRADGKVYVRKVVKL